MTGTLFCDETKKQDFLKINKWMSPRLRLLIIKSGLRPGRDQESHPFSSETKKRTWRDLNKCIRFPIFWDESRPERPGKIHKRTSPRPNLINNQNWRVTEARLRVSVPLVLKPRRNRESRQSVVGHNSSQIWCGSVALNVH